MQPSRSPLSGGAWVLNEFSRLFRPRKSTPPEVTGRLPTESRPADSSGLLERALGLGISETLAGLLAGLH